MSFSHVSYEIFQLFTTDELPEENVLWGTVGLGGVITIDNPNDDNPDDPMPVVLNPEEQERELRAEQEPPHELPLIRQGPVRQRTIARQEPIHVAPLARQGPAGQQPVAVAVAEQQPPLNQQEPAGQLGNPDVQAIGQNQPAAGNSN